MIKSHPPALDIYMKRLIDEHQLSQEEISKLQDNVFRILNEEFDNSKDYLPSTRDWLAAYWAGFKGPEQLSRIRNTGYIGSLPLFACVLLSMTCIMKVSGSHEVMMTLLFVMLVQLSLVRYNLCLGSLKVSDDYICICRV